jgi:hypothetical protein
VCTCPGHADLPCQVLACEEEEQIDRGVREGEGERKGEGVGNVGEEDDSLTTTRKEEENNLFQNFFAV